MTAGKRLSPSDLGMLASLNRAMVDVWRRPRVGIVSTGDELVDVDQIPTGAQIVNSSAYALAGAVIEAGGEATILKLARDATRGNPRAAGRGDPRSTSCYRPAAYRRATSITSSTSSTNWDADAVSWRRAKARASAEVRTYRPAPGIRIARQPRIDDGLLLPVCAAGVAQAGRPPRLGPAASDRATARSISRSPTILPSSCGSNWSVATGRFTRCQPASRARIS